MTLRVVVLSAGLGTRMKSSLPKVLHPLCGRPMIRLAVETAEKVGDGKPVLVIGHGGDAVRQTVGDRAEYAEQKQLLGTADAVRMTEPLLKGKADFIMVIYGDMPLWRPETLQALAQAGQSGPAPVALLTGEAADARGFGRILRDGQGRVTGVVEEAMAAPEQLRIREINPGAYCFRADWLWNALAKIQPSPKGEYYLTDLVGMAAGSGGVTALPNADEDERIGINTLAHLAEAEAALRRRINRAWMEAGVTMPDPATVYVSCEAKIGAGTVLLPNTHLEGPAAVGEACRIGPNTILRGATVGDRCKVEASVVEQSVLEEDVSVGPFAHLRSGAYLERGVHMGNFGEVKNSRLAAGAKMGHFSYLGDAAVGADVNIGAGTITCNFDGKNKNKTEIGAGAFIGSDSMLVAPLKIGRGARTGAGSVVTRDVPDYTLVVGVPARAIRKLEPSKE